MVGRCTTAQPCCRSVIAAIVSGSLAAITVTRARRRRATPSMLCQFSLCVRTVVPRSPPPAVSVERPWPPPRPAWRSPSRSGWSLPRRGQERHEYDRQAASAGHGNGATPSRLRRRRDPPNRIRAGGDRSPPAPRGATRDRTKPDPAPPIGTGTCFGQQSALSESDASLPSRPRPIAPGATGLTP